MLTLQAPQFTSNRHYAFFVPSTFPRRSFAQGAHHIDVNMAQDTDAPKAADKGKGKAVDESKDEKPILNGKKEDDKKDGKCWLEC